MVIQHNLEAMNANRQFSIVAGNLAKNTEKLSRRRGNRISEDTGGTGDAESG